MLNCKKGLKSGDNILTKKSENNDFGHNISYKNNDFEKNGIYDDI